MSWTGTQGLASGFGWQCEWTWGWGRVMMGQRGGWTGLPAHTARRETHSSNPCANPFVSSETRPIPPAVHAAAALRASLAADDGALGVNKDKDELPKELGGKSAADEQLLLVPGHKILFTASRDSTIKR